MVAVTFVDQKRLALAVLAGTAASIVELTCGGLKLRRLVQPRPGAQKAGRAGMVSPGFHPLQFPPLRCRDRYEPGPVQRGVCALGLHRNVLYSCWRLHQSTPLRLPGHPKEEPLKLVVIFLVCISLFDGFKSCHLLWPNI